MKTKNCIYGISVLLVFSSLGLTARAQAFVSAKIGVDVGNCPVTAPCRSIAYSLTQATEGGTVNVIDSGVYEPFVVNKSVTVQTASDVFYTSGREWFFSSGGVGPLTVLDASGYRVSDLRFGDFDGDGKTDVFSVGNHWQVSYGATSGWQPLPHKLTGSVAGLIVADFNGDRRADVATAGINPLGSLVWKVSYSGVGDWTQTPLPRNSVAAIGRFDGSGGADLLLWNDNFLEIDPGGSGASHSHSRQDMR